MSQRIVLIDDDEITNLINIKIIKSNFDITVNTYTSAREALDQLKEWMEFSPKKMPDLLFVDINMPDMDGWRFLLEYSNFPKEFLDKCKIFMLSSSSNFGDEIESKRQLITHELIYKPLTLHKLQKAVA